MIPIKDKKYMLNCQGPYDYNRYSGEGVSTGDIEEYNAEDEGDTFSYGFKIPGTPGICFFLEREIVAEFTDSGKLKTEEQIQNQIDSESLYCKTCDSCGETGCCPPIKCQAVKCKYGEINLKDYKCTLKQWEIMFNALKIIVEECGGGKIGDYAKETLNAVDKEWDKLYSKE